MWCFERFEIGVVNGGGKESGGGFFRREVGVVLFRFLGIVVRYGVFGEF